MSTSTSETRCPACGAELQRFTSRLHCPACGQDILTSKAMDIRAEIRELREFGRALPSMALLELAQRLEDIAHPENAPPHETSEGALVAVCRCIVDGAQASPTHANCVLVPRDFVGRLYQLLPAPAQKASEIPDHT